MPIQVQDRAKNLMHTVGTFDLFVDLDASLKGTHMSRFVEALHEHEDPYDVESLRPFLETLRNRLHSTAAYLTLQFPFFLEKKAPVTLRSSLMNYQVTLNASLSENEYRLRQRIKIPLKTLCPCSKSIAKYGAHNQRGVVTVQVETRRTVWVQDLIQMVESSGSSQLYALLKRPDEKHVTEEAYENPVFVEDLVRNVVTHLQNDERIVCYQVEAENFESIHNHNAYALIRQSEGDD
tara:strand:+ start:510 stop:1217 length:708 start_codon:yes stop_codon:yes gene_type:complete